MSYNQYHFAGQGRDEKILFYSHRHPLRLLGRILEQLFVYLGAATILGFLGYLIIRMFNLPFNGYIQGLFFSLLFLAVITTIMAAWSLWYRSVCIITDSRLVKIVPKGFFFNYTRELKLEGIKDTSFSYENFFQGIFNYGKLQVIGGGQFIVKYIPNPRDLHHYITKLVRTIDTVKAKGGTVEFPEFIPRPIWKGKNFRAPKL
ncbi:MAG: PH domain-containing protein [Candidatus Abawacabacteria bacterium]|nr:PH domain-containing protein [Candidatus Abawacabacteria bacterium]